MMRNARGLTLVEVTIAMVLGSLVMIGLVGFYISSQSVWLESSSRAVTQREGTLALETMVDSIRIARSAQVTLSPDALHQRLTLTNVAGNPFVAFYWNSTDSLIHWERPPGTDRGPLIAPRVVRFQVSATSALVSISALHLLDPEGDTIELRGGAAMYNRP